MAQRNRLDEWLKDLWEREGGSVEDRDVLEYTDGRSCAGVLCSWGGS